jgi:ATP/maltotriose-dependent transcriptional regulator MalT
MRFLGIAYAELGYHYYSTTGEFDVAMNYYQVADSILSANHFEGRDHGNVLVSMGHLYLDAGIYDKAREYFERARTIYQNGGFDHNVKKVQLNLAEVAIAQQSYGEAEMLLNGIRDYFEAYGQESFQARVNNLLGEASLGKKFPEQSILFFNKSYELRERIADTIGMIDNLILLSEAHMLNKDLQKSEQYALRSVKISKESKSLSNLVRSFHQLARICRSQNDLSNAYEYLHQYNILNDSLLKLRNVENLQKLETRYETKKKESEIEMLTLENKLSATELERKKAVQTRLIVLLLLLASCFAFLWYWMQTRRKMEEIRFQQEMLRKSEMIDRLQNQLDSILTSQETKSEGQLIRMEELNQLIQHPLSEREYDVLESVAKGNTNLETSEKLFISQNTVKFHLKNIYNKLEVANRVQALNRVQKN